MRASSCWQKGQIQNRATRSKIGSGITGILLLSTLCFQYNSHVWIGAPISCGSIRGTDGIPPFRAGCHASTSPTISTISTTSFSIGSMVLDATGTTIASVVGAELPRVSEIFAMATQHSAFRIQGTSPVILPSARPPASTMSPQLSTRLRKACSGKHLHLGGCVILLSFPTPFPSGGLFRSTQLTSN